MHTVSLEEATESDAADIAAAFQKPEWDITNPESVTEFDGLDEVVYDLFVLTEDERRVIEDYLEVFRTVDIFRKWSISPEIAPYLFYQSISEDMGWFRKI